MSPLCGCVKNEGNNKNVSKNLGMRGGGRESSLRKKHRDTGIFPRPPSHHQVAELCCHHDAVVPGVWGSEEPGRFEAVLSSLRHCPAR